MRSFFLGRRPGGVTARRVVGVLLLTGAQFAGCSREEHRRTPVSVAAAVGQASASCRRCHEEVYRKWESTDHALANRVIDPARDAAALRGFSPTPEGAPPEMVLGHEPLWQPLVPFPGGRWQAHEMAFDPARQEWFNVFGRENRRPGEWGHWTGRGMNWNSMCAPCHMTGYQRGYDVATDTYRSRWVEHGVGCIQCHGPMDAAHGDPRRASLPKAGAARPFGGDRKKMMQTCAPCHARNERLTERFQPGDNYHDHYRVTLPVDAAVFYPDGQQRDEDFNWTSVLLSRMGHAGVTCLDCHDPHTTNTILPWRNNQLCQQCHGPPGRVMPTGVRAVPIDPVAHSRHAPDSAGNMCVSCHMPTTTYMQRAARHDHGWLKPDPLLTKELGIPNACSGCHADQPVEWVVAKADAWYGSKLNSRQRERARAVAGAQADKPGAAGDLTVLLRREDIPAWRATYLSLLARGSVHEEARAEALKSLQAVDPLERAAAVRYFAGTADGVRRLTPFLEDPVRLVRLEAEWVLSPQLPAGSARRTELDEHLSIALDQPGGRVKFAQDLANRGELRAAESELARAADWDPFSPGIRETQGLVLAHQGRMGEAGAAFRRAAELDAQNRGALALEAGLAYAEAGEFAEAEGVLELAVRSDPRLHRAWYNLGLLRMRRGHPAEAMDALRRAEAAAAMVADYPFAQATVLRDRGDYAGAREAARRVLELDPTHEGARQVLRELNGK